MWRATRRHVWDLIILVTCDYPNHFWFPPWIFQVTCDYPSHFWLSKSLLRIRFTFTYLVHFQFFFSFLYNPVLKCSAHIGHANANPYIIEIHPKPLPFPISKSISPGNKCHKHVPSQFASLIYPSKSENKSTPHDLLGLLNLSFLSKPAITLISSRHWKNPSRPWSLPAWSLPNALACCILLFRFHVLRP